MMRDPQAAFPVAQHEEARLAALHRLHILDTPPEQAFDELTSLARYVADTPFALISLLDRDRQWFKSAQGLQVQETPRLCSFCTHTLNQPDSPLIVHDTCRDPRFAENPFVQGDPNIRFYLGVPLVTQDRHVLGTLCVLDQRPRYLDANVTDALCMLARQVMSQLELRQYQRSQCLPATAMSADPVASSKAGRAWEQQIAQVLAAQPTQPLSLLWLHIDHLPQFRQRHGVAAATVVACELQQLLAQSYPAHGQWYVDGDEYGLLLPNSSAAAAHAEAEQLRRRVEQYVFHRGSLTISVGVATTDAHIQSAAALLQASAEALAVANMRRSNLCVHAQQLG